MRYSRGIVLALFLAGLLSPFCWQRAPAKSLSSATTGVPAIGESPESLPTSDRCDMGLFLAAPDGPIRIDLFVTVGGEPLREVRRRLRRQLLARGTRAERAQIGELGSFHFDGESEDTRSPDTLDLFRWLDVDGDFDLSARELAGATERLRMRDTDGDDLVVFGECRLPPPAEETEVGCYQGPGLSMTIQGVADPDAISDDGLMEFFRRAYPSPFATERPALQRVLLEPAVNGPVGLFSVDRRKLSAVRRRSPRLELEVRFPAACDQPAELVVRRVSPTLAPCVREEGRRLALVLPALTVSLDSVARASVVESARDYVKHCDSDGNGYLDEREAWLFDSLSELDGNGDGKVFTEEFGVYLEKEQTAVGCRVREDRSTVAFTVLDANCDRRLSPREMREAPQRLRMFDANRDGIVQLHEMSPTTAITLGLGDFHQWAVPGGAAPSGTEGSWFARMDRNSDGDLSRREFLGSRETFDRLDSDRDGLISSQEAVAARSVTP